MCTAEVAKGPHVGVQEGALYEKIHPTFSDALALVRKELWVWEGELFAGRPERTKW